MPPSPFYTNAVESINSLLKLRTDYKKQELTTFVIKLKELVEAQFSEVDRAIAGVGEYEVAKEYPNFHYSAARWCAMSEEQRKRVLKRFQSSDPVAFPADSSSQADISSLSHGDSASNNPSLSNPLAGLGIPDYVAGLIWTEAKALLKEDSNFVNTPGNASQAWMVARSSGSTGRPRFVRIHQGHYECEADCTYFQTCKVCAHVVATAQRNGDLEDVITWHKRQDHGINATALAQTGLPKAAIGKKQATRKGVSKKKSAKIRKLCAEVDESSWQPRAALTSAGQQSSQLPSSIPPQALIPPSTPTSVQVPVFGSQQQMGTAAITPQAPVPPGTPTSVQALVFSSQQQMGTVAIPPQAQVLPSTPSQMQPSLLTPQQQVDPFMLSFIRGNISVCYGCKQRYQQPINPPNDLCVMHREWRTFMLPGSPTPQSRFGNAYYHLHLPCIWSIWPQFNPQR